MSFEKGDRVKRHDADMPNNIQAYQNMRGTVIATNRTHVCVVWDCDLVEGFTDGTWYHKSTLVKEV